MESLFGADFVPKLVKSDRRKSVESNGPTIVEEKRGLAALSITRDQFSSLRLPRDISVSRCSFFRVPPYSHEYVDYSRRSVNERGFSWNRGSSWIIGSRTTSFDGFLIPMVYGLCALYKFGLCRF